MTQRPILNVNVTDETGKVLADVDAASTADALAYFLTSRGIETTATENGIKHALAMNHPNLRSPSNRETLVVEGRHPITGVLEYQYKAEVH